jgi:hypothetical protein
MKRSLARRNSDDRRASDQALVLVLERPRSSECLCERESSGHKVRWLEDGERDEKRCQALAMLLGCELALVMVLLLLRR